MAERLARGERPRVRLDGIWTQKADPSHEDWTWGRVEGRLVAVAGTHFDRRAEEYVVANWGRVWGAEGIQALLNEARALRNQRKPWEFPQRFVLESDAGERYYFNAADLRGFEIETPEPNRER